ncbi:hypothetical protein H2199_009082 [Coniosporium tulheliwenetii]|uniref:Uncharacterized protein n=1 Tax=Coniosporium tulheliwenetii TaxID=3383036 RepID=A0ACC2YGE1_9PEZI|nr:hypothetical protein H2199_009082 [Cladosporium sp. JES 115]
MGNGAGAFGAPRRLAVSSTQHAALPAQAMAARQDTNTGKPDEVNEADGVGSRAQSQLGSAEDDLARQLGLKVLEYQRYQKLVSQAIRQRNEHSARVQEHEKRIAMEQTALHGLREQLQLLQDNIKETEKRVAELSHALPHERALEQTARCQTENIEKQMPEELPDGGKRPYHGCNELIASNDMQTIDAMTVDGKADVRQWIEDDEADEVLDAGQLFWRQTWDARSRMLSAPREHCVCRKPFNPDKLLIACSNQSCRIWMHAECIAADAVRGAHKANELPPPIIAADISADIATITNGTESAPAQPAPKKRCRLKKGGDVKRSPGPVPPAFTAEIVTWAPDSTQEDGTRRIQNGLFQTAGSEKKCKIVIADIREGGEGEEERGASFGKPVRCLACGQEVA